MFTGTMQLPVASLTTAMSVGEPSPDWRRMKDTIFRYSANVKEEQSRGKESQLLDYHTF